MSTGSDIVQAGLPRSRTGPTDTRIRANLSANSIGDAILRLLRVFGLRMDDMVVYLREDRDADEE